ncbi:LPS export ABC transporter periplasmic protein LptC [Eionea flava]
MSKLHIAAIIGLSLILCFILWQSPPQLLKELGDSDTTQASIHPDGFLVNSKTTQYNEDGNISHIMTSDRTHYFQPENAPHYSLLTTPYIRAYDTTSMATQKEANATWQASSKAAKATDDDKVITMSGDVLLIQQANTQNAPATTIETETLLLKPNEQYAETDKPVIIKNASGVTTSTGMTVSLDKNTIELLSNVRSRYEPR